MYTPGRIGVDRLLVRDGDDQKKRGNGKGQRHSEMNRGGAREDKDQQDLFRRIRHRRHRVGREDSKSDGLRQAFVARLRQ
jgi:hypothetical protein